MIALDRLSQIIPPDIALANKALATSLQGVTNIGRTTLPKFAAVVANTQTTYGLHHINNQSQPVSDETVNYYQSTFGVPVTESNPNGTMTIVSGLGVPSGLGYSLPMANVVSTMANMDLSSLTVCYTTLVNCLNGDYNTGGSVVIPAGLPGAGTYANKDLAITTGIIPATDNVVANLQSTYAGQCVTINNNWSTMTTGLSTELNVQQGAMLDFSVLQANAKSAVMNFVSQLPKYGQDTTADGLNQYLQALADLTTMPGQAIVAVLRQGQNQAAFTAAGIGSGLAVPATPSVPPPKATLTPAQPPYPG